ncbi:hypothetical protein GF324_07360 [bacterium]|nr:hypothetical protein [bacterium]
MKHRLEVLHVPDEAQIRDACCYAVKNLSIGRLRTFVLVYLPGMDLDLTPRVSAE